MNFWRLQGWLYEALFTLVPHRNLVADTASVINWHTGVVLDAGCGTGKLGEFSECSVVGMDFSDTMLRVAKNRSSNLVRGNLSESLPFPSSTFSGVVSLNVLYALEHPKKMIEEAYRVLERGGELMLATPTSQRLMPLVSEHLHTATHKEIFISILNIPRYVAWIFNLAIRGLFENSDFHFYSEVELVAMCESVGFEVLQVTPCYAGIDAMIVARKE